MKTTGDGKAYIEIEISPGIHVKTWNNALSDVADDTLIDQNSPVFSAVADLGVGDAVTFSGAFVSAKEDFVREASMSESGSMSEPSARCSVGLLDGHDARTGSRPII
jgi:hypothetical protein